MGVDCLRPLFAPFNFCPAGIGSRRMNHYKTGQFRIVNFAVRILSFVIQLTVRQHNALSTLSPWLGSRRRGSCCA